MASTIFGGDCPTQAKNTCTNAALSATQQAITQAQQAANTVTVTCNTPGCNLDYVPLEPLPGGGAADYTDLGSYLNYLFPILISIGAILGVGTFTVYGVLYMTSSVAGKKEAAVARMKGSIYGLLLLVSSVLILNTINPDLTKFDIKTILNKATNAAQ